jgi:hypothetical protein
MPNALILVVILRFSFPPVVDTVRASKSPHPCPDRTVLVGYLPRRVGLVAQPSHSFPPPLLCHPCWVQLLAPRTCGSPGRVFCIFSTPPSHTTTTLFRIECVAVALKYTVVHTTFVTSAEGFNDCGIHCRYQPVGP